MEARKRFFVFIRALAAALLLLPGVATALEKPDEGLVEVGIQSRLGEQIDRSLQFTTADGELMSLEEFAGSELPLVLVPAYYNCPRLCGLLLDGVVDSLNLLQLTLGKDYRIATVSFNPKETPELAKKRRTAYRQRFTGQGDPAAWEFFVGTDENIHKLMTSIGYQYQEDRGDYSHTAAIVLLTPQGKVSQYLSGVRFPAFDLKLALVEASDGNIGSPIDHVLLYCFRFDPTKGKYTWTAYWIMRAGGLLTLVLLGGLVFRLWWRERRSGRGFGFPV